MPITPTTDILTEDEVRLKTLLNKPNQFTGEGCDFHVHKVTIKDMGDLRVQWLTDEVYNNELYQAVIKCGGIHGFIKTMEAAGQPGLTYEDVFNGLILARISRDPWFAFYMCFSIRYKKGGKGAFRLNFAQLIVLSELEAMRIAGIPILLIILKARQWGGSTLADLYMAWMQLFVVEQWNAAVIAQTKDTARRIKDMYEFVLENMPGVLFNVEALKFAAKGRSAADFGITDNKNNPVRDNTMTVASYENFESVRGADFKMAHLSEIAFWRTTDTKSAEQVLTNLANNVPEEPNAAIIIESTANGASGYLYTEYMSAKQKNSAFHYVFIPFFYIENDMLQFKDRKEKKEFAKWLYDNRNSNIAPDDHHESGEFLWELWKAGATLEHIKWYVKKRAMLSSHGQMAQEAPYNDIECFVFSGGRVFSPELVINRREMYVSEPEVVGEIAGTNNEPYIQEKDGGCFTMWKKPSKKRYTNRYIVSVDVGGRSNNADYSVITVLDRYGLTRDGGKLEVVARWRGHVRYDRLAELGVRIARLYGEALLVFESNTFDKKKAEANEYVEQGDHIRGILNAIADEYDNLYYRAATSEEDIRNGILTKVGFQTNVKTKQDMVDNFITIFEDDLYIDHDELFYTEAAIYEQRANGSYGNIVGRGNHDDVIMSTMIACLVSRDLPLPKVYQSNNDLINYNIGTVNESAF